MDNFMDKLAQRFNSGDVIKANAQAEAEEFARTKEKLESYEVCLDKLQSLSGDNTQVLNQMTQVAQEIGQSEQQLKGQVQEVLQSIDVREQQLSGKLAEVITSIEESQGQLNSQIQALSSMDNTNDKVSMLVDESIAKIRELESSAIDTKELEQKIEAAIASLEAKQESMMAAFEGKQAELVAALDEKQAEMVASLGGQQDDSGDKFAKLEEYLHKESVKVYRNVQASVKEENQKQMDAIEKLVKTENLLIKKVNVTTVATLAILLFVLILQILMSLNII